jgi:hypothetical protein
MVKKIMALMLFINILYADYIPNPDPGTSAPIVSIEPTTKNITEGSSFDIEIKIDNCPEKSDIKIKYFTQDSNAKANQDYEQKRGVITFKKDNCEKVQNIRLKTINDSNQEGNEKFYFKIQDNGTSSSQDFSFGSNNAIIIIKDDDSPQGNEIDIGVWKDANKDRAAKNDIVYYNVGVWSNTEGAKDYITIEDIIPSSLKIIEVDSGNNLNCNTNGQKITCISTEKISKDTSFSFDIKTKVITDSLQPITNTAKAMPNNLNDPYSNNNEASHTLTVLEEGINDTVEVEKTVNKKSVNVYDTIIFTITATNRGWKKRIAIRDMFPLEEEEWGTTGGAFKLIKYEAPDDVECINDTDKNDNPYIFCSTKNEYEIDRSFSVKLYAKVLKGGVSCNTAHGYEYKWKWRDDSTVCIEASGNAKPILLSTISNQEVFVNERIDTIKLTEHFSDPEGEDLTFEVSRLPDGVTFNASTSQISGSPTKVGSYTVTVKASDPQGEFVETTFTINVLSEQLKAVDDKFTTYPGVSISGSLIENDKGYKIKVVSNTNVREGTLVVNSDGTFTYTPKSTTLGIVTFSYTIEDDSNKKDTANVTIEINTGYVDINGTRQFELINPPETRNIVGNYVILGNSSLCITGSKESFDAQCQDNKDLNNNNYMTKYIDIDGNNGIGAKTWNPVHQI